MPCRGGLGALIVVVLAACAPDRPPRRAAHRSDDVPANSLSDARLHGRGGQPEQPSAIERSDPTQPYTTPVGQPSLPPASTATSKKPTRSGFDAPKENESTGKGAVTRSDCDRLMDKYIELEIATNPKLEDVPPEIIEQAKQTAREQHGDAPCTATRAQYTCAMAATSTSTWQRCMR